jgi:myo-inositol-1(or 4)-monophosphatase
MHGIPHFAISIALQYRGEIIAAYIFDPMKNEEFFAEKGRGAYLNGDRLRVSVRDNMTDCLLATGLPFAGCDGFDRASREIAAFMPLTSGIRRMGAASLDLAYVAAGRFDAYWETGIKSWDIAAGLLLVTEAGGMVTNFDNNANDLLDNGQILASNGKIHAKMLSVLNKK